MPVCFPVAGSCAFDEATSPDDAPEQLRLREAAQGPITGVLNPATPLLNSFPTSADEVIEVDRITPRYAQSPPQEIIFVKRFPWFRFRAAQDDFNSAHPPGADSRWSSILAIASLIASGVAAYLLQGSSSARAGLSASEIDRWMWTLVAILGVQMAYQQLRMTRLRRYLRCREALFRIVTENAADMIALVSAKGRRLYNSPAYQKILGYTAAELSETSSLEQVHPDDRYKQLEASRQAHETGIDKQMEYRIRHKNGSWLVFESK